MAGCQESVALWVLDLAITQHPHHVHVRQISHMHSSKPTKAMKPTHSRPPASRMIATTPSGLVDMWARVMGLLERIEQKEMADRAPNQGVEPSPKSTTNA